jgi:hypothetical protein
MSSLADETAPADPSEPGKVRRPCPAITQDPASRGEWPPRNPVRSCVDATLRTGGTSLHRKILPKAYGGGQRFLLQNTGGLADRP